MKLKNRKTGEIADVEIQSNCMLVTHQDGRIEQYYFNSIKDLLEWEDYEEPKEYWYLDYGGRTKAINDSNDEEDEARKQIGNYFETKEEAEKVVEKLKAWKRLEDKGFRITNWNCGMRKLDFVDDFPLGSVSEEIQSDLNLLFGGEE